MLWELRDERFKRFAHLQTGTYKTCTRKKLEQELCKILVQAFFLCKSCGFLLFYFTVNGEPLSRSSWRWSSQRII